MDNRQKELSEYRVQEADNSLKASMNCLNSGLYKDSINRSYYCICQPKNRSKGHRILGHFLANIVPPKSIQRHMFLIFMLYCLIFEIEGCPVFS